jgi:hypothetical protein
MRLFRAYSACGLDAHLFPGPLAQAITFRAFGAQYQVVNAALNSLECGGKRVFASLGLTQWEARHRFGLSLAVGHARWKFWIFEITQ